MSVMQKYVDIREWPQSSVSLSQTKEPATRGNGLEALVKEQTSSKHIAHVKTKLIKEDQKLCASCTCNEADPHQRQDTDSIGSLHPLGSLRATQVTSLRYLGEYMKSASSSPSSLPYADVSVHAHGRHNKGCAKLA